MTLIELIVFIIVVSVGLAGVLSVFNVVVKGSADPLIAKQALAVAESMLEEIQLKQFCDPNPPSPAPICGGHERESARRDYDDVFDYHGYSRAGIRDISSDASTLPGLIKYGVTISVVPDNTPDPTSPVAPNADTKYMRVTVTVSDPSGQTIVLTGYRYNYD